MSRFWLVEVEDDLATHMTTRTGVWCGIKILPGVKSVTDLRAISLDTLATLLLADADFRDVLDVRQETTSFNNIRAYWNRIRQPRLPGVN